MTAVNPLGGETGRAYRRYLDGPHLIRGILSALEELMANPFEDEDGLYYVLVNEEGQHSLWPGFIEVPAGWTVVHGKDNRQACLEYVEANWTDMRPKSLVDAMAEADRSS